MHLTNIKTIIKPKNLSNPLAMLLAGLVMLSGQAWALGDAAGNLPAAQQTLSMTADQATLNQQQTWQTANFKAQSPAQSKAESLFGEQLFAGGFSGVRSDGVNQNYRVLPGDQVIIRIWGNIEADRVVPVDTQGNIFIPSIGPVQVLGLSPSQLDAKVRGAVKSIYRSNVEVYTQLQGVQPVGVYVSGYVANPGRYAGTPHDSLLFFIHQAGGIDPKTGSFRQIQILRDQQIVTEVDLYDFIVSGQVPQHQFQEGDVILVKPQGAKVSLQQTQNNLAQTLHFELNNQRLTGVDLLRYTQLPSNISHILVSGTRNLLPYNEYLSLEQFKTITLERGDVIMPQADMRNDQIIVKLEGSFLGQSHFVLPKNARLAELLDNIPVDADLTDIASISIRRQAVAEKQRQSLDASLRRLETTYLTASSSTPQEAAIRVQEAQLISEFVQRARQVEPNGRLVVATSDGIMNVRLQDGDIITIPTQSEAVMTSGQVLVPTALVYRQGFSVQDYIDLSGGLTKQADSRNIVLIRQSGEVIADRFATVYPGDEILVLPKVPTKNIQLATSITQILYQIAIAAKVALDL
ncbi:polysaccharide biosynthesis/export family protein [Thiomicrospira microaerophila]|uniref:polysaccharide biosynthesis/export family protein n=1 Tax=Thiomicrospira microaerophila TaxID=406020 RepID=UPI00200E0405|nr:polysaccharide biosynthesis/export family protein [Thiomicrospira microaerophila]UQB43243.1 polysaccharide biosynthesis/export family protein [Thiomicrospira microaerophila]